MQRPIVAKSPSHLRSLNKEIYTFEVLINTNEVIVMLYVEPELLKENFYI